MQRWAGVGCAMPGTPEIEGVRANPWSTGTVLDDFSRYIIAWKLCTTMKAEDVTATLELALDASGLDKARALHRPRLLSDNGSSYISDDLAKSRKRYVMAHVRELQTTRLPGQKSSAGTRR